MSNIKTKRSSVVNEKTLLVTVDIAKKVNTGYCRCPNGDEIKPFEFLNTFIGFQLFGSRVEKVKQRAGLENIVVGLESTGSYGEPLLHFLSRQGVQLVQVNPLHTKRMKELTGNSPGKTDRKDPKVIADIIELGRALTVVIPEGVAADLRRLTQGRERAIQRRTVLYNQLQDLVFLIFPEFWRVIKDVKSRTAQYLLRKYPTPREVRQLGCQRLAGILKEVSRGRLDGQRAEALYEAAGQSAGIEPGQRGMLLELKQVLLEIEGLERFVKKIEQEMSSHLEQVPYCRSILSVKGIGKVTAAALIGEVGDFHKFQTLGEILKLAGLDLYEISSGDHRGTRHISKRGRSLLRKTLFFAALNVVRKGGVMHAVYQQYIQRGMLKLKALVAIARKLLRVLFALVRDHREYRINYAASNLRVAA